LGFAVFPYPNFFCYIEPYVVSVQSCLEVGSVAGYTGSVVANFYIISVQYIHFLSVIFFGSLEKMCTFAGVKMSSRRRDNFKLTFLAKDSGLFPLSLYKPFKCFSYKFQACLLIVWNELFSINANSFSVIYNITFFYYSFLEVKMSVI